MAGTPSARGDPITDKRQLVAWFEAGNKPAEQWRIGTEHEKFAFSLDDHRRLPYDGPRGIRALLEGLTRYGWQPVLEHGLPIALNKGDCNISLEPGGQFELSGAPLESIHQTCDEVNSHLDEVKAVCAELGAGMLGIGFDQKFGIDSIVKADPVAGAGNHRFARLLDQRLERDFPALGRTLIGATKTQGRGR